MHVTVHHTVTDSKKWEQGVKNIMTMSDQGRLPQGLKGLMFLPSVDGRKADCLWEANSLEALKRFLDHDTGAGAKNEYYQIDDARAFGLPGHEELIHKAA